MSFETTPQSWLRQSSSPYTGEPFSSFCVENAGVSKGAESLGRLRPKGGTNPLGVGERNGVGITNEILIAYKKGRNTCVSAL